MLARSISIWIFLEWGENASSHPVVEARADANHQIGPVHRHIGFIGAVHAQHAQPIGMIGGERAQTHQRRGERRAGQRLQLAQKRAGARARIDHAAAGIEHRRLRVGQHLHRFGDVRCGGGQRRRIAVAALGRGVGPDGRGDLDVLGDVDQHRAGAALRGDLESLVDGGGKLCRVLDEVIVLAAMAGDANRVGFLKSVRTNQAGGHLAGDDHHWNRVHEGIGNTGDRIGRAGAAGDQHHAGLARGARIAFRRMCLAGFMADKDVTDARFVKQRVVNRQHRAAGIAEHEFHAQANQAVDQNLGAAAFTAHAISHGNAFLFSHAAGVDRPCTRQWRRTRALTDTPDTNAVPGRPCPILPTAICDNGPHTGCRKYRGRSMRNEMPCQPGNCVIIIHRFGKSRHFLTKPAPNRPEAGVAAR